jgi:hypothetical protein
MEFDVSDAPENNVIVFKRRLINDWPRHVYLADLGDGEGTQVFASIQYPDDTTPEYIRADLVQAQIDAAVKAERERCAKIAEELAAWLKIVSMGNRKAGIKSSSDRYVDATLATWEKAKGDADG